MSVMKNYCFFLSFRTCIADMSNFQTTVLLLVSTMVQFSLNHSSFCILTFIVCILHRDKVHVVLASRVTEEHGLTLLENRC
jgi:hypothetical protein